MLALGLVWGFSAVADSAQFSTLVTELAEQAYVGTALGFQMAVGFALTVPTIWLLPFLEDEVGWRWAFVFLVPGPVLGTRDAAPAAPWARCPLDKAHPASSPPQS